MFGVSVTETYLDDDRAGSVLQLCNVDFVLLRVLRLRPFSEYSICVQNLTQAKQEIDDIEVDLR